MNPKSVRVQLVFTTPVVLFVQLLDAEWLAGVAFGIWVSMWLIVILDCLERDS